MIDLTAYFITTDRINATRSLASLEEGQELVHPVVVVRNRRPLAAAYRVALECATRYVLTMDDDVFLRPGVVPRLLSEFRRERADDPKIFRIGAKTESELTGEHGGWGLRIHHVPLLREVGFPDSPHVMRAQQELAGEKGLRRVRSNLLMGMHTHGTPFDIYRRYLWLQIRINAGECAQKKGLEHWIARAREENTIAWWLACLGMLDGMDLGEISASKREDLVGPEGERLDFDNLSVGHLRSRVEALLSARQLS